MRYGRAGYANQKKGAMRAISQQSIKEGRPLWKFVPKELRLETLRMQIVFIVVHNNLDYQKCGVNCLK